MVTAFGGRRRAASALAAVLCSPRSRCRTARRRRRHRRAGRSRPTSSATRATPSRRSSPRPARSSRAGRPSEVELEVGGAWSAVRAADGTIYLGSDDEGAIWAVERHRRRSSPRSTARSPWSRWRSAPTARSTPAPCRATRCGRSTSRGKASKLVRAEGRRDGLVARAVGNDGRLAGTGPDGKLFAIDEERHGEGGVRHRRQAHPRDGRDLRRRASGSAPRDDALLFRHDPENGHDPRDGRLRRQRGHRAAPSTRAASSPRPTSSPRSRAERRRPRPRSRTPRASAEGPEGQDGRRRARKPGADKAPPSGTEPDARARAQGQGRAVPRARRRPARAAARADPDLLHVAGGRTDGGRSSPAPATRAASTSSSADDSVSTAFDVDERAVAQLLLEPGGKLGVRHRRRHRALPRDRPGRRRRRYTSEVFDAQAPARFGSSRWRSAGKRHGRDPLRQHRGAGPRLERVADAARRRTRRRRRRAAARSPARRAATSSSAPRSTTTTRALRQVVASTTCRRTGRPRSRR